MSTSEWIGTIPGTAAWRHCHTRSGQPKVAHPTKEAAEAEARYFNAQPDIPVQVYWCDLHQGWHCGSVKT